MDCQIARPGYRYLGVVLALAPFILASNAAAAPARRATAVQAVPPPPPASQGPPRDRVPPSQRVGTAAIKGRVIDGVTGNPISRARVRLTSGPAGSRSPILTDSTGAFELAALPSGAHNLVVEKATYMAARYPDANRPLRAGLTPLLVREGQVIEDLTIPLFHGSAIVGRVLDAHGDPVESAQVRVLRLRRGGRPTSTGQMPTNDLGEFRLSRLQPGRYLVQVRPQMMQSFNPNSSVADVPLPQPVPTYYPGALGMSQAQPITLNRGETVAGVEVVLAEGTPTVVTGVVLRSDGEPVTSGSVSARVSGPESTGGYDNSGGTGIQGGSFQLNLPPGDYTLEAQVVTRQGPGPAGPEDQLFGSTRISVGGGTTEAISIMVGRGATASGHVVFEGSTPPPPSPGQVRVPFYNPDGPECRSGQAIIAADWSFKLDGLSGTCGAPPRLTFGRWTLKAVTLRGQNLLEQPITFETGQQYTNVQVVVTDKRTQMDLRVTGDDGLPTREYVAIAFPFDKAKWNPQLRQVTTHVPPQIVRLPAGATAGMSAGATVAGGVVGSQLSSGGMMAGGAGGYTFTSGAGSQGGAPDRMVAFAPGEYYVIAVDDIDAEDTQDPAVLERLASSATRVVVTDEAPIEVPLRRFNFADVIR
jgi:hypothetical protein